MTIFYIFLQKIYLYSEIPDGSLVGFFLNFIQLRKYARFSVYYMTLKIKGSAIVVLTNNIQIGLLRYFDDGLLKFLRNVVFPIFVLEYNCYGRVKICSCYQSIVFFSDCVMQKCKYMITCFLLTSC